MAWIMRKMEIRISGYVHVHAQAVSYIICLDSLPKTKFSHTQTHTSYCWENFEIKREDGFR